MSEWRTITDGLVFPEGPVVCSDDSVIVAEIPLGRLTRVLPDGTKQTVAEVGGGPNGLAVGPDGFIYVCNNGGMKVRAWQGLTIPAGASDDYTGGSIQRVDVATGAVETLYTEAENAPIRAPNDIVFDTHGGFWFTDNGKSRGRERDVTGVFYAKADGSMCREVIFPMAEPNGIGLSPDGATLYVAETPTASLWAFEVIAPGEVALEPSFRRMGGRFVYGPGALKFFDSLAVQADGMICVATIGTGGITTIASDGSWTDFVATDDPFTTNLAFGGASLSDIYVTLSGAGRLVTRRWPYSGLCLSYQNLI